MPARSIEGLDGVRQALQNVPVEARALLREAITVSTRVIHQRMLQASPVDTGALREAMVPSPPKGRGLTGTVNILPGTFRGRVPSAYVIPVEFGKYGRPFIRSTAEAETPAFIARIAATGKSLERNLATVGGRNL